MCKSAPNPARAGRLAGWRLFRRRTPWAARNPAQRLSCGLAAALALLPAIAPAQTVTQPAQITPATSVPSTAYIVIQPGGVGTPLRAATVAQLLNAITAAQVSAAISAGGSSAIASLRAALGLANVATSGSYTDLTSKPTLGTLAAKNALTSAALAGYDASGNPVAVTAGSGVSIAGGVITASGGGGGGGSGGGSPVVRLISTGTSDTSTDASSNVTLKWTSATAAAKSQALPACASGTAAYVRYIKDGAGTAAAYPITVTAAGGTLERGTSVQIAANGGQIGLQCDGAGDWGLFASYLPVVPDITFNLTPGLPLPGEVQSQVINRVTTLASGLPGSQCVAREGATSSAVVTISRIPVGSTIASLGSATFAASGSANQTCTLSFAATTTFNAGDIMVLTMPATQDVTLGDLSFIFAGR